MTDNRQWWAYVAVQLTGSLKTYLLSCSNLVFSLTYNVHTLPSNMFGLGYFWLETPVIIKVESHPCYSIILPDFKQILMGIRIHAYRMPFASIFQDFHWLYLIFICFISIEIRTKLWLVQHTDPNWSILSKKYNPGQPIQKSGFWLSSRPFCIRTSFIWVH